MSSTNRSADSTENYETPFWTVRRLLEEVYFPAGEWLEPMAGTGRLIHGVNRDLPGIRWTACELRGECAKSLKSIANVKNVQCPVDFINDFSPDKNRGKNLAIADPFHSMYDVGIANPAFSLTFDTLSKMLVCCEHVAILQRANWLGSGVNNGKYDFLRSFHPDVYMLPDRVKFLLNGKFPRHPPGAKDKQGKSIGGHIMSGDSIEYAWVVWGPKEGRKRMMGNVMQLAATPKEERIAAEEAMAA